MAQMMLSSFLNMMHKEGWLEIARYPAYYPAEYISEDLTHDQKLEWYIIEGGGVLIETFAGSKSYFFNTHHKLRLNPFYSTTEPRGKHHLDQKGSA